MMVPSIISHILRTDHGSCADLYVYKSPFVGKIVAHGITQKKKNEVMCDNVRLRHCLQWKSQKEIVVGDQGHPANKKK